MKMVIRFIEVNGMPRMVVEQPIREKGDGIRLINWARLRYLDFKDLCDEHKKATEQVLDDKKKGITRAYRNRFTDLFERVFDRRRGDAPDKS